MSATPSLIHARDLSRRTLYRYFRSGGVYRYDPKPRIKALRLAWAYRRKA